MSDFYAINRPTFFLEAFGHLTDDEWLATIEDSVAGREMGGIDFPGFPPDDVQLQWVGLTGQSGVRWSFSFYRDVKHELAQLGRAVNRDSRVLDFGCGWGRHLRYFLREVPFTSLYGVDPDRTIIAFCKREVRYGNFELSTLLPPLDFPDGKFDLIYSYSVFSHLSEDAANRWIAELHRILKPGGSLILTTQGRTFLDALPDLAVRKCRMEEYSLSNAFGDLDDVRARFERGEHIYRAVQPWNHLRDIYGEAIVPPSYVEATWAPRFERFKYLPSTPDRQQEMWTLLK